MAKDVYYFSHDANARNDIKTVNMMADYGMAGYGMYWFIVEVLRELDDYKLKHEKQTWRALARQMCVNAQEVEKFITDCIVDYELFKTDGTSFWSDSLLKRMKKVDEVKEKRSQASRKRWDKIKANEEENNAKAMQMDSKCNANVMQTNAKEIKEKEKKEKEKVYIHLEGVETVKLEEEKYNKLIEEYDKNYIDGLILNMEGWITENNKTYKNYYLAVLQWIKRDGDKAKKKNKNLNVMPTFLEEPPEGFKVW